MEDAGFRWEVTPMADTTNDAARVVKALRELVALKDLRTRAWSTPGQGKNRRAALMAEYERRKGPAWDEARAALEAIPVHIDHPTRHYDRTCPACNACEKCGGAMRETENGDGVAFTICEVCDWTPAA